MTPAPHADGRVSSGRVSNGRVTGGRGTGGSDAGTRLLLIADTHVPTRARDLPERVWDEVDAADIVIHAGDWMDVGLLDSLEERSARLIACWGNNDGPDLRECPNTRTSVSG